MKILTYRLGIAHTNCYLIYDEKSNKACLIDPAEYYDRILDVIESKGLSNDILTFGDISLKVIHTPGHTKGSCCFICESEKVMFSGDTLFKNGIGRFDLYGGNYGILMESLRELKNIKENYKIYPGHGDSTTLDNEVAGNPYLR